LAVLINSPPQKEVFSMLLADYHIHSTASSDAMDTMTDMARAARDRGITQLCFTDHCDLDHYNTGKPDPHCFDYWPEALRQYEEARTALPDMDIRLGMELGEANHDPEQAARLAALPELDFVLGSLHNLRDKLDFYHYPYESEAHCHQLLSEYLDELMEIAAMPCFDVMAHIGYTRRYMLGSGFSARLELETYGERLRTLLRRLIERGHGIELNCSGMRHPGIHGPIPEVEILRLYRELGGEIITVGTDAHLVHDAGLYLQVGYDILRELGFRYFTTYRQRKPEFNKL
jgi:histidinol-phosphatase (PHP family)